MSLYQASNLSSQRGQAGLMEESAAFKGDERSRGVTVRDAPVVFFLCVE